MVAQVYEECRARGDDPGVGIISRLTEGCFQAGVDAPADDVEERTHWMARALSLYQDGCAQS